MAFRVGKKSPDLAEITSARDTLLSAGFPYRVAVRMESHRLLTRISLPSRPDIVSPLKILFIYQNCTPVVVVEVTSS